MYTPKIFCSIIIIISILLSLAIIPPLFSETQRIIDLEEFIDLVEFDINSLPRANVPMDYKLMSYNPNTGEYDLPYIYWEEMINEEDLIYSAVYMNVVNKTKIDFHFLKVPYNGIEYNLTTSLKYEYSISAAMNLDSSFDHSSWEATKDSKENNIETEYDRFIDGGMYYIVLYVTGDYYEPGRDYFNDIVLDYDIEIIGEGHLYPVTVRYRGQVLENIGITVAIQINYDIEYTISLQDIGADPGSDLEDFVRAVSSNDPCLPEDLDIIISDYIDSIYSTVFSWIENYFTEIGIGEYSGGGGEGYIEIEAVHTMGSGTRYSIDIEVSYELPTDYYSGKIVFSFMVNGYDINDHLGCSNGLCYKDLVREPSSSNELGFTGSFTYTIYIDFSELGIDTGSQTNLTVIVYLYGYNEPCYSNCYSRDYLLAYDAYYVLLSLGNRSYMDIVETDPPTSTPLEIGDQSIRLYLDFYIDSSDLHGDIPYLVVEAKTDYGVIFSSEPEPVEPNRAYGEYMIRMDFTITEADLRGSNKLYIHIYIVDSSGSTIAMDSIVYNICISRTIEFYIDYDIDANTGEIFTDKLTGYTPIGFSYILLVEHVSGGGVLDSWRLILPPSSSIPINYITNSSIPYSDGDYIHIVIEGIVDPIRIYRAGYIRDLFSYEEIYGSNKYFPTAHLYLRVVGDGYGGISDLVLGNGVWDPCSKNVWVRVSSSEWIYVSPYSDRMELSVYGGFDVKVRTVIAWEHMLKHVMASFLGEVDIVSPTVIDRVKNIDIWYGQRGTAYSPEGYIYREYISFEVPADKLYDPLIYRDTSGEIMPAVTFFHELGHMIKEHMFPDNIRLGGSHGIADESDEYVAYDEAHSHFISVLVRDYGYGRGLIEKGFMPSLGDIYFGEPYLQEALFSHVVSGEKVEGCIAAVLLRLLYSDHYISPMEAVKAYNIFIKVSTLYKYYNGHPPRTIMDFLTTLLAVMPLHRSEAGQYPYIYYDGLIDLSIRYRLPIRIYPIDNLKKMDSFLVIVYPMDQVSVSYNGSVYSYLDEPFIVFTYDNLSLSYEGRAITLLVEGTGLTDQSISSIIGGRLYRNIHSEIITYGKTDIMFKGDHINVYGYTGYTKTYIKTSKTSRWFNSTGSSLLLRLFNRYNRSYLGLISIGCDIVIEFNEDLEVYVLEGEISLHTEDYNDSIGEGYMFKISTSGVDVAPREYDGIPWDFIPPSLYSWNIDKLYAMPNDQIKVFVEAIDRSGLDSIELIVERSGVNKTYYPSVHSNGEAIFNIQLMDTGAYLVYVRLVDDAGNSVIYKLTTLIISSTENNAVIYSEENGGRENIENIGSRNIFGNIEEVFIYFIVIISVLSVVAAIIAIVAKTRKK